MRAKAPNVKSPSDFASVSRSSPDSLQRRRDAGTLAPKPHGGGPRPVLGFPEQVRLAMLIAEHPDATLNQLKEWGGFACTLTTLWRTLRRFRLTYKKKTLHAGERDTPEVQAKRRRYRSEGAANRGKTAGLRRRDGGQHGDDADPRLGTAG